MIYWRGKQYELIPNQYNGTVHGYLFDGLLLDRMPKSTKVKGYIVTEDGVILVVKRNTKLLLYLMVGALFLLVLVLLPHKKYEYYQVTFSINPILMDGTLYCNIINESERTVTVQFLNSSSKTLIYTLDPEDTLPYLFIDFIPTTIRYNGDYDFPLEVQSD